MKLKLTLPASSSYSQRELIRRFLQVCLSAIIRFGFCHCFSVTLLFPQKTLCCVLHAFAACV